MSSEKKQLVLFSVAGGLFTLLMLVGLAGNVIRGNYKAVPLVGSALLLSAFLVWFNHRRTRIMFRDPTPDRLITHYHATVRRIPHADAAAAYLSALAAAVYGQFDRAREELGAVDWDKAPAMYRGHRLHVLALMEILENQDHAEALRLAEEANALEQSDKAGGMTILHDAILLAAGNASPEVIEQTKRAAARSAGVMPAICAWALSLHFERLGQSVEASRYRKQVIASVPNFVGADQTP